jgi:hypothetical protein
MSATTTQALHYLALAVEAQMATPAPQPVPELDTTPATHRQPTRSDIQRMIREEHNRGYFRGDVWGDAR